MKNEWKILSTETCFQGFFKVVKYRIAHTLHEGGWIEPIEREIFERGTAAAVLPYDPKLDKILLIEQFRAGAIHDENPWLTELIAGMIEPGESPESVILRESVEEAGIELSRTRFIQEYFVSPGGTTEKIYLYYGEADLSEAGGFHGLRHEGEDIRVSLVSSDELFNMIDQGSISNAMTLLAAWWFRHHHRLGDL